MAYEESLKSISLPIAASLATQQYRLVKLGGTSGVPAVSPNTTSGGPCIGVNQGKEAVVGRPAQIAVSGVSKIVLGATLSTAGINVMSDITGRAVLATTGKYIVGTLITGGVANDVVSMHIDKQGIAD